MKMKVSFGLIAMIIGVFATALTLLMPKAIANDEVFRIQLGRERGSTQFQMERRIYELERAVQQLQTRVFQLQMNQAAAPVPEPIFKVVEPVKKTTCYIETPFDGTFTATENTETAARAGVLRRCGKQTNNNSVACSSSRLKCGQ